MNKLAISLKLWVYALMVMLITQCAYIKNYLFDNKFDSKVSHKHSYKPNSHKSSCDSGSMNPFKTPRSTQSNLVIPGYLQTSSSISIPVSSEYDAKKDSIFIYNQDDYNYDLKFLSQASFMSDWEEQWSRKKKNQASSLHSF
jgi:hypothetical protein